MTDEAQIETMYSRIAQELVNLHDRSKGLVRARDAIRIERDRAIEEQQAAIDQLSKAIEAREKMKAERDEAKQHAAACDTELKRAISQRADAEKRCADRFGAIERVTRERDRAQETVRVTEDARQELITANAQRSETIVKLRAELEALQKQAKNEAPELEGIPELGAVVPLAQAQALNELAAARKRIIEEMRGREAAEKHRDEWIDRAAAESKRADEWMHKAADRELERANAVDEMKTFRKSIVELLRGHARTIHAVADRPVRFDPAHDHAQRAEAQRKAADLIGTIADQIEADE